MTERRSFRSIEIYKITGCLRPNLPHVELDDNGEAVCKDWVGEGLGGRKITLESPLPLDDYDPETRTALCSYSQCVHCIDLE